MLVAKLRTLRKFKRQSNFRTMLKGNRTLSGKPWSQVTREVQLPKKTIKVLRREVIITKIGDSIEEEQTKILFNLRESQPLKRAIMLVIRENSLNSAWNQRRIIISNKI